MKRILSFIFTLCIAGSSLVAQERGNQVYPADAAGNRLNGNILYQPNGSHPTYLDANQLTPYQYLSDSSFLVHTRVLKNVRGDEFVAMFAINQVDSSVDAVNEAMDSRLGSFLASIRRLGIPQRDLFVDFITQVPIYDYRTTGRIANEYSPGFELKKTVSIRFLQHQLIDTIVRIAARHEIYDLVKVDYVINNLQSVYDELMDSAIRINDTRRQRYERFNGGLNTKGILLKEEYSTRYPQNGYLQYSAYESTPPAQRVRGQITVPERKVTTFYFNSVDIRNYDLLIAPAIVDPVVQVTLNMTMRYIGVRPDKKALARAS